MSWDIKPTAFIDVVEKDGGLALRKLALEVLSGVVLMTPVDTGRARGGWLTGINRVPSGEGGADKTGASTISSAATSLQKAKLTSVIWIANNVEYIVALENGHSKQAPGGMVNVVVGLYG